MLLRRARCQQSCRLSGVRSRLLRGFQHSVFAWGRGASAIPDENGNALPAVLIGGNLPRARRPSRCADRV